jgi:hypothetical protein
MGRKRVEQGAKREIVNFDFNDRTYQIDPEQKKVYRSFVEIEKAKAFEIISCWRASHVSV